MNVESHTELDSHANMPVVGKYTNILAETGQKVDVSPFTRNYQPLTVPLVDATVRYDNPYDGKPYILVLRNTLYVPSMENNLIPPFMLREMGVTMNDVPKIHKEDPTIDDHAITFMEMGFRIPLSLWGIFSYFPTSKPTHDDLINPTEVYILSPATWNPHSDAYSGNEESMLDLEGNMQQKKDCQHRIIFDDIEDDTNMVTSLEITQLEQETIDAHLDDNNKHRKGTTKTSIRTAADSISNTLGLISNTLVDHDVCWCMCEKEQDGRFAASIGSTNIIMSQYISNSDSDDNSSSSEDDDMTLDLDCEELQEQVKEFLSHAMNGSQLCGVTPKHLSKIWCISTEDAR